MKGSLLGPNFPDEEIRSMLDRRGIRYAHYPDETELLHVVAQAIAGGAVIGWFSGRMEFGPRALGARSIIGDARNVTMQTKMNLSIKFRESFRPFAPSVLREHVAEYFDIDHDSPYMLLVADVSSKCRLPLSDDEKQQMKDPDLRKRVNVVRSSIPAVTHVDMSARVQTVDEERHGRYYRMMREFYRQTGCPVIVNTSFNIRGEPIVGTPHDAYRCFMATDMDFLVLENCVLRKSEQPSVNDSEKKKYVASFHLD